MQLGLSVDSIPWSPGAFRVHDWRRPGVTIPHVAGWYYVQEEIAMTAVRVLSPQRGDQVLDLCAAPGGKTAQLATQLAGQGSVVANEVNTGRLTSLSTTVSRLGLTNVLVTQADGRSIALPNQSFDRVLVDAPCSGEGTLRRRNRPKPWRPEYSRRVAAVQRRLLERSLALVKPGGVVVYSTCTFAPEENEAVIDAVLGDRGHLESAKIAHLKSQPGLTQWHGQYYRQDMRHACRYFPHFNNTGGFFVARIRRSHQHPAPPQPLVSPALPPVPAAEVDPLAQLQHRFGVTTDLKQRFSCWSTGQRRLWLLEQPDLPLPGETPQLFGLAIASQTQLGLKPSTAFLQRFGPKITQNKIELPHQEAVEYFLQGRSQPLSAQVSPGYVHVCYGPFHLGCGRYRNGWLQSQLPKALRWKKAP